MAFNLSCTVLHSFSLEYPLFFEFILSVLVRRPQEGVLDDPTGRCVLLCSLYRAHLLDVVRGGLGAVVGASRGRHGGSFAAEITRFQVCVCWDESIHRIETSTRRDEGEKRTKVKLLGFLVHAPMPKMARARGVRKFICARVFLTR